MRDNRNRVKRKKEKWESKKYQRESLKRMIADEMFITEHEVQGFKDAAMVNRLLKTVYRVCAGCRCFLRTRYFEKPTNKRCCLCTIDPATLDLPF